MKILRNPRLRILPLIRELIFFLWILRKNLHYESAKKFGGLSPLIVIKVITYLIQWLLLRFNLVKFAILIIKYLLKIFCEFECCESRSNPTSNHQNTASTATTHFIAGLVGLESTHKQSIPIIDLYRKWMFFHLTIKT